MGLAAVGKSTEEITRNERLAAAKPSFEFRRTEYTVTQIRIHFRFVDDEFAARIFFMIENNGIKWDVAVTN